MLIQLLSDTHLEFYDRPHPERHFATLLRPFPESGENVIVLTGDIGHPFSKIYSQFLSYARSLCPVVLVIPGNHEFYPQKRKVVTANGIRTRVEITKTEEEIIEQIEKVCSETGCHFLRRLQIGEYIFLGAILWSPIEDSDTEFWSSHNDRLSPFQDTIEKRNSLFERDYEFLKQNLSDFGKYIVITHYVPSPDLIHSKYRNSPGNSLYYAPCQDLLKFPIAWLYGHTHQREIRNGETMTAVNPYGYLGTEEPKDFQPLFLRLE